jgi:zinc transporter ZupT
MEFAGELPVFWQGVPMVVFVALGTFGALLSIGGRHSKEGRTPLTIAYMIALGIGIHNLGEGMAIGAAFALGEAALGRFLVLGFTLHNVTEGVGIAAPVVRKNPGIGHFALLVLLAGFPAVVGTWIGGFSFNPVLASVLLAVGLGAILQVIWDVAKLMMRTVQNAKGPVLGWVNLAGVMSGVAVMYATGFLVKF